jgi:myo-inositol-1(or 4)-monophosphatase
MEQELKELREGAEEAARLGGEVLRTRWSQPRSVSFKGGIDLVTDADRASEVVVLEYLRRRFPTHDIVAEESSAQLRGGKCRWHVDPLDGTTNYAHGVPHFCVSVAVEDPEGLAAGAVYQPLNDELFSAGRGGGAHLNGRRLSVSDNHPLSQCLVGTGFPYDVWTKPDRPLGIFKEVITHARGIRRAGAAALDLAYVASGRFDAFFELGLRSWDVAAGALLVLEAGGKVSDMKGAPIRLEGGEIMAANARIHADLIALTAVG